MSWDPEDDDFSRLFPASDDLLTPQPAIHSRWRLLDESEAAAALASFLPDDWAGGARMLVGRGISSGVGSCMDRVGDALNLALKKWAKGAPFSFLLKKTSFGMAPVFRPRGLAIDAARKTGSLPNAEDPPRQLRWEKHLVLLVRDTVADLDWVVDWDGALGGRREELNAEGNPLLSENRLERARTHGLLNGSRPELLAGLPGRVPAPPDEGRVDAFARQALADWDGFLAKEGADALFADWESRLLGKAIGLRGSGDEAVGGHGEASSNANASPLKTQAAPRL